MNIKRVMVSLGIFVAGFLFTGGQSLAEEPSVGNVFIELYNNNDQKGMEELIKARQEEVGQEVFEMVQYAMGPNSSKDEQDFLFNIAGMMAQTFEKVTGDGRLLGAVQQNFQSLLDKRKAESLSPDKIKKVKDQLAELGKGAWMIRTFKMDPEQGLLIEIDIKEATGGEFTPTVDFKTGQKAKEIVKKEFPDVHAGKISWSSMGVGLKLVMLE